MQLDQNLRTSSKVYLDDMEESVQKDHRECEIDTKTECGVMDES